METRKSREEKKEVKLIFTREWKGEEADPNKELVKLKKAEVEGGHEFDSPGVSRPLSSSYSSTTTCSFHP